MTYQIDELLRHCREVKWEGKINPFRIPHFLLIISLSIYDGFVLRTERKIDLPSTSLACVKVTVVLVDLPSLCDG